MKPNAKRNPMIASTKKSYQSPTQKTMIGKTEIKHDYASGDSTKYEPTTAENLSRQSQITSQESKRDKIYKPPDFKSPQQLKQMNSPKRHADSLSNRSLNNGNLNFLKRQMVTKPQEIVSPRVMSPKVQVDIIQYLKRQNQNLIEENHRKDNLITKLLTTSSQTKKVTKNVSAKQLIQQPPKTVETQSKVEPTRLPQITTPQPQMKHRFDTLSYEGNEFQVPNIYNQQFQQTKNRLTNEQNWSFGKNANANENENDLFTQSISNFNKLKNAQFNIAQKQPQPLIKTNLTKPLLKLPQEFHIQAWNSKR